MHTGADTVVIVTGGASGLGAAAVRRFASQGAKIALFDLNKDRGPMHEGVRLDGAIRMAPE